MQELTDAISKSHDTGVGPDDIHYQMLKHLPIEALNTLLESLSLDISQIPRQLANLYSKAVVSCAIIACN